jgi:penicillin-binding protein 2
MGTVAAHVLGHVGRISPQDKSLLESRGLTEAYQGIESIGKDGVEKTYEAALKGLAGYAQVETRCRGPRRPHHLAARLDPRQHAAPGHRHPSAEDRRGGLRRTPGAAVAIEPATGDILAMVSQPSFDPNAFVDGIDPRLWKELNQSPDRPLSQPAPARCLPAGLDHQAVHGAGRARDRHAHAGKGHP